VAKAQATWVWDGHGRAVHLTVVAQGGGELGRESLRRLRASLDAARDRNHRLRLASVRRVAVIVRAVVTVAPDRVRADVGTAATSALLDALSFERQDFGRALRLGDVFAALQDVAGVSSVDVDALTFKDPAELGPRGATSAAVQPFLRIDRARPDPSHRGRVLPAEMAWVESPGQDVTVTAVGGLAG
jgi:hypothetical protein